MAWFYDLVCQYSVVCKETKQLTVCILLKGRCLISRNLKYHLSKHENIILIFQLCKYFKELLDISSFLRNRLSCEHYLIYKAEQ